MRFPVCAAVFSFVLLGLSLAAIIAPTLVVASGSSSLYSYYVGFGMFQACVEYKTNAVVVLGVTVTSASEYDKCMTYDNFEVPRTVLILTLLINHMTRRCFRQKSTYNVYAPDGITDAETGGYLFVSTNLSAALNANMILQATALVLHALAFLTIVLGICIPVNANTYTLPGGKTEL